MLYSHHSTNPHTAEMELRDDAQSIMWALVCFWFCLKGSHFVAQAALEHLLQFSCHSFLGGGGAMKGMYLHALLIYLARVGICVWCSHKPIYAGTHTLVYWQATDYHSSALSLTLPPTLLRDVVSLCSLVWPRTGYVDQAGIKLTASALRITGMCHHTWLSIES